MQHRRPEGLHHFFFVKDVECTVSGVLCWNNIGVVRERAAQVGINHLPQLHEQISDIACFPVFGQSYFDGCACFDTANGTVDAVRETCWAARRNELLNSVTSGATLFKP